VRDLSGLVPDVFMRVLFCYPNYPSSDTYGSVELVWLRQIEELVKNGFDVKPFCISPNPPSYAISVEQLNRRWFSGEAGLMKLYENLERALEGCDVLLNVTGVNLHPEFVSRLPGFKVFQFNDDPENSYLSKFFAPAYDLCLVGNIAEVGTYKSWGIKNVHWMPIGLQPHLYDRSLTYERIVSSERDIDLFMMVDRLTKWRKPRLDRLHEAFPTAHFYGRGWPRGYLAPDMELAYLLRSKISPNIHNSSGPINYRTFYAPANGVMLICDNKKHLSEIYELGKEAVGFDSIEECIDLCHYYLEHDEERRSIAANGWRRAVTDYNEISVFKKTIDLVNTYRVGKEQGSTMGVVSVHLASIRYSRYKTKLVYSAEGWLKKTKWIGTTIKKMLKRLVWAY
jgi:spore maturation protein CgeB